MESKFILTPESVTREVEISGTVNADSREPIRFMQELGSRIPMDTGLLPPGVRSYSQAGDHSQMVIELPPGVNMINWSFSESDAKEGNYNTYRLAQPYRVIVASFLQGDLLGARMFYSPYPIANLDQTLYHQNVPNINCTGYEDTAVGWVCLYQKESWKHLTLAERAFRIIERCSGVEAYNDANMDDTDGTRFYGRMNKPIYTSSAAEWEKKTEQEGYEWTLNPDEWIEVRVAGLDDQSRHVPQGVPLTLRMVMDGMAPMYYSDGYQPKPDVALRREDLRADPNKLMTKVVTEAFVNSGSISEPTKTQRKSIFDATAVPTTTASVNLDWFAADPVPVATNGQPKCAECGGEGLNCSPLPGFGPICEDCMHVYYRCEDCSEYRYEDEIIWAEDLGIESYFCEHCYAQRQKDAGAQPVGWDAQAVQLTAAQPTSVLNVSVGVNQFICYGCGTVGSVVGRIILDVIPEAQQALGVSQIQVCVNCFDGRFMCLGCYGLHQNSLSYTTADNKISCGNCVKLCPSCNKPFLKKGLDSSGHCTICAAF